MAEQNVPSAFTESSIEISARRSELKDMVYELCGDSTEVQDLQTAIETLDDEKLLVCHKMIGVFKNCCVLLLLVLGKKPPYTAETFNMIFAKLAETLFGIKLI